MGDLKNDGIGQWPALEYGDAYCIYAISIMFLSKVHRPWRDALLCLLKNTGQAEETLCSTIRRARSKYC